MMQGYVGVCMGLLLGVTTLCAAPLEVIQQHINVTVSSQWATPYPPTTHQVTFIHNNKRATINIVSKKMNQFVTANALFNQRAASRYDGWINVVARALSSEEKNRANVSDGFLAVFVQQNMNSDLSLVEHLVAEYFFIKGVYSYRVSLETTKEDWGLIQEEWRAFIASFWLGKQRQAYLEPHGDDGQEAESWRYNTGAVAQAPAIYKQPEEIWQYRLPHPIQKQETDAPFLWAVYDHKVFVYHAGHIQALHVDTGLVAWEYALQAAIQMPSSLHVGAGLLFLKADSAGWLALDTTTGLTRYRLDTGGASALAMIGHSLFFNDNGTLKRIDSRTGKQVQTYSYPIMPASPLITGKTQLVVQLATGAFAALDAQTAQLSWTSPVLKPTGPVVAYHQLLYIPVASHTIEALSLTTGKKQWRFQVPLQQQSSRWRTVGAMPGYIVVHLEDQRTSATETTLARLNTDSAEEEWRVTLPYAIERPTITPAYVAYIAADHPLQIRDTLSGKSVPYQIEDTSIRAVEFQPSFMLVATYTPDGMVIRRID